MHGACDPGYHESIQEQMKEIIKEPTRRNVNILMEEDLGITCPSGFGIFLPNDKNRGEKKI